MRRKTTSPPVAEIPPEFAEKPVSKQVIMYVNDEDIDPNRLYTLARLEDATIDKIARRVVELMAEQKGKKK